MMRGWLVAVTILMTLACGGFSPQGEETAAAPPKALDCPEGTSLKGGEYPAGRDIWAGWPILVLDPAETGGFQPADEAVEVLIATDMSGADAMWWCADEGMTPKGPFLQRIADGDYELWLMGTLQGTQRQGEIVADWMQDGRVVRSALRGSYLDGLPHGEWWWGAEPSFSHEERAKGAYLKGLPDGQWVWTGEGQRAVANYLNGVLQGEWLQTWEGSEQTGLFKDGARDGEWAVVTDGEVIAKENHGEVEAKPRPRPNPRPQPRPQTRVRTR